MKPEADDILRLSILQLATTVAPLISQPFALGQIGLVSSMMALAAKEYERGADLRATENTAMRSLFLELGPQVADAGLKAKLEAAAKSKDTSLRISALNTANYALRLLLSELHAHVESLNAREAERRIWSLLRRIAESRLVTLNPQ